MIKVTRFVLRVMAMMLLALRLSVAPVVRLLILSFLVCLEAVV